MNTSYFKTLCLCAIFSVSLATHAMDNRVNDNVCVPWTLSSVAATVKPLKATTPFTQTKSLGDGLVLTSHGLFLTKGDSWTMETIDPISQTMTLTPITMVIKTDHDEQRVDLQKNPSVASLFISLRQAFNGDFKGLEEHFFTEVHSLQGGKWQVHLVPRDKQLKTFLPELRVEGKTHVERVDYTDMDGVKTTITVEAR